jgi:hypothetical protein
MNKKDSEAFAETIREEYNRGYEAAIKEVAEILRDEAEVAPKKTATWLHAIALLIEDFTPEIPASPSEQTEEQSEQQPHPSAS